MLVPSTPWRKALTTRISSVMSIACFLCLFLIVDKRDVRGGSGSEVAPGAPDTVHTVAGPSVLHFLKARLEGSNNPELSLQPGESPDPEDLARAAHHGVVGVVVVVLLVAWSWIVEVG